ncbi:hypothetical protein ACIRG5_34790 [Lentzea sp. NPDC102401]|uniref:hypothetical protein n=1 Tax=Lentzea sp. NPDC102401 TaxID=3364128 RepID=UPI00381E3C72
MARRARDSAFADTALSAAVLLLAGGDSALVDGEPSSDTTRPVRDEPVVLGEPAMRDEPEVPGKPTALGEPAARDEPEVPGKPTALGEPAVPGEPSSAVGEPSVSSGVLAGRSEPGDP